MRSSFILVTVLAAAVAAARCGGKDGGSTSTPTAPGAATPATVTVSVVATQGNQSFVPNPVQKASADLLVFKNNDTVMHRIVMDDGSADFGDLAPGASSQPKAVLGNPSQTASIQPRAVGSGNFHCAVHPSMVGSVNGATAPTPPPGSGDGY